MSVWINEFHYDNAGADTGEFIEIAGLAGTDLTGWSIALYNGNDSDVYDTISLSGTIPDDGNGAGTLSFTAPGSIQNGAPDGFALVDDTGSVVSSGGQLQFLSYEGVITAAGGPAAGLTSTDVGVSESGSDPIGESLQLQGSGDDYSDFTWAAPAPETPGAANNNQALSCFLSGTMIATPDGERAIETLSVGDLVVTVDGRTTPVRFVGRQTVATRFDVAERLRLVRVRAGALGVSIPSRDLTLTADHALAVEGMLVNAGALVNGTTVIELPLSDFPSGYTVYHLETEAHELIVADGAPAETFIDYVTRRTFDNYGDYVALYNDERIIREMDAPRVSSARHLPSHIQERIGAASDLAA